MTLNTLKMAMSASYREDPQNKQPFTVTMRFRDEEVNIQAKIDSSDDNVDESMSVASTCVSDKAIQVDLPVMSLYGQRDSEVYDTVKFRPDGIADGTDMTRRKRLTIERDETIRKMKCAKKSKTKGITIEPDTCEINNELEGRDERQQVDTISANKNGDGKRTESFDKLTEKGPRITEIVTLGPDDRMKIRRTRRTTEISPELTPGTSREPDFWINAKTNDPHNQDEWNRVTTELVTLSSKVRNEKQHDDPGERCRKRTRKRTKSSPASMKRNRRIYETESESDEEGNDNNSKRRSSNSKKIKVSKIKSSRRTSTPSPVCGESNASGNILFSLLTQNNKTDN